MRPIARTRRMHAWSCVPTEWLFICVHWLVVVLSSPSFFCSLGAIVDAWLLSAFVLFFSFSIQKKGPACRLQKIEGYHEYSSLQLHCLVKMIECGTMNIPSKQGPMPLLWFYVAS